MGKDDSARLQARLRQEMCVCVCVCVCVCAHLGGLEGEGRGGSITTGEVGTLALAPSYTAPLPHSHAAVRC